MHGNAFPPGFGSNDSETSSEIFKRYYFAVSKEFKMIKIFSISCLERLSKVSFQLTHNNKKQMVAKEMAIT